MTRKKWVNPWYLSNFFEDIWRNLEGFNIAYIHTFREGSKVSDLLANHGYEKSDI